MGGGRGVAIVAGILLLAVPARGADLDSLERSLREAYGERARLVEERTRRMGEAAALADEIARQKGAARAAPRADRRLEDALKRFDRLAGRLDGLDRKIGEQDRSIATLRRKFEEAATNETARITGSRRGKKKIGHLARELDAIEQARRRVAALGAREPSFRPVLEVAVSPEDGPFELQQKIQLLESERERVQRGMARLDADANVLAARILVKRRLSAELESAAQIPGSELALLRHETENLAQSLRDLTAQRETVLRQKAELTGALAQVDVRLEELRAALRAQDASQGSVR